MPTALESWPAHWLAASGVDLGSREPLGATHTIAELVDLARGGPVSGPSALAVTRGDDLALANAPAQIAIPWFVLTETGSATDFGLMVGVLGGAALAGALGYRRSSSWAYSWPSSSGYGFFNPAFREMDRRSVSHASGAGSTQ